MAHGSQTRTTYSSNIIPNAPPTESKIETAMEKYTLGGFFGKFIHKVFWI